MLLGRIQEWFHRKAVIRANQQKYAAMMDSKEDAWPNKNIKPERKRKKKKKEENLGHQDSSLRSQAVHCIISCKNVLSLTYSQQQAVPETECFMIMCVSAEQKDTKNVHLRVCIE